MSILKIYVILSSIREGRFGEKPAAWIYKKAKANPELDVELIDLRELNLPLFNESKSPKSNKGVYINSAGSSWAKKVGEADGFIVVTPEYNHGYPPSLKNALDWVYPEWNNKPIAFVSYGMVGGARSVEQLRQVAVELQLVPIREAVHIYEHWKLQNDQGELQTETFDKVGDVMLEQLVWWAKVLKEVRSKK